MNSDKTVKTIFIFVLSLIVIAGIAYTLVNGALSGNNLGAYGCSNFGMMGGGAYGASYIWQIGMIFLWAIITIAILLLIIWLFKQLNERNERDKKISSHERRQRIK
jgi:uncharacterized membrane protein